MANDPLAEFLESDTARRFELVLDSSSARSIRSHLGDEAFREYEGLAQRWEGAGGGQSHLGGPGAEPFVFVPGVMGSLLKSNNYGGIWWLSIRNRSRIADLGLAEDGVNDANPKFEVTPCTVDLIYDGFVEAAHERQDLDCNPFYYDWRKQLTQNTERMRKKIQRLYSKHGRPVHLIAHSMGGLMARCALMRHEELWGAVGRIVLIGTPNYGSVAIGGYLKNHLWGFELMSLLGRYLPAHVFQTFRGVLGMLPAPEGVYPGTHLDDDKRGGHPCFNFDPYDIDAWGLDLENHRKERLASILYDSAALHREMRSWHDGLSWERRKRIAVIAGVGYKTLFSLKQASGVSRLWRDMEKETSRKPGDIHREGDGRVPVASALLERIGDTRFVRGVHGSLPMIRAVSDDAFRWINGEPMELPSSQDDALQSHLATSFRSETPVLDGEVRAKAGTDDPGFLDANELTTERSHELEKLLEAGAIPELERISLL